MYGVRTYVMPVLHNVYIYIYIYIMYGIHTVKNV